MENVNVTRAGAVVRVLSILGFSVVCLRLPLEIIHPEDIWTDADGQATHWIDFKEGYRSLGVNVAAIQHMLPAGLDQCGLRLVGPCSTFQDPL